MQASASAADEPSMGFGFGLGRRPDDPSGPCSAEGEAATGCAVMKLGLECGVSVGSASVGVDQGTDNHWSGENDQDQFAAIRQTVEKSSQYVRRRGIFKHD